MTLPGGFSPTQALKQVGDYAGVYGDNRQGADYDVLSQRSFDGGARDPVAGTGGFWGGQQGQVNTGWTPTPSGGYVLGANTGSPSPTPNPTPTPNNPTPVDPYARWGGEAAFNQQKNTYGTSANNQKSGAQTQLRDVGNTYDSKTNTFVDDITSGQGELNRGFAGNELNLRRSMQNIIRSIQNGIRSGGVALAGVNASDSGAADAMARAYAQSGNQQTGEARGQAAEGFEELQRSQGTLNSKRSRGEQDLGTFRDTETGRVRSDFGGKIDALSADAQAQGFGDVVDKSVVDQVLGEALARLSQIDQGRQQKLGGVKQWSPDQIMKEAIRMDELGQAGNAFSTTAPNVNYGGPSLNGAPLGQLPIYVKGRDDTPLIPKAREEQR